MRERIVSLTEQLVAIPTHETEGPAQERLAEILTSAGFSCELPEIEPGRPNLLARRGEGGVFLCSHMDTHPPHAHPDPFACHQDGDELIGRGAVDTKGLIAAMVAALEVDREADALVLITCDEERGGLGSERAIVPDGPWFADGGIVLEPTDFAICTAQPGNIDVRVDVSATPVHAYAPERPGSPIHAILAVIEELDTCAFSKVRHPLLGRPPKNIGTISGGEHAWRTPARSSVEITFGVVPGTDLTQAEAEVRSRLDDLARRWGNQQASFTYEIVDTSEPSEIAPDLEIARRLAQASRGPLSPAAFPSWTDAGNLLLKHGLPCVVFGAGDLAVAHSDRESVRVSDLMRLADILRTTLRSGGTAP